MKKSVADKWIRALRSGKYKQTKKALNNKGEMCCLGVLCEISKLSEWNDLADNGMLAYLGDRSLLPQNVEIWSGMKTSNGRLEVTMGETSLAILNDGGKSFKQIANYIERYWKVL